MFEAIKIYFDLGERLVSLAKSAGYILLACFIYLDFVLKGVAEVSLADENIKNLAFNLFSARIIYTSIVVAILEALGNLLVTFKPQ